MIDLSNLTLGEVAMIEDLSGRSISDIGAEDAPKGKALAAIAMIVKRRTGHPTFSWNHAQALTLTEANELLGADEEDDEESDAGKDERSKTSAPKSKPRSSSTSA